MSGRKLIFAVLFLFIMSIAFNACAATVKRPENVYLSAGAYEGDQMPADAVKWFQSGNTDYYFLMPAAADLSNARIWLGGDTEELTLSGKVYHSGDPIILSDDAVLEFVIGKKTICSVHVMRGAVDAMFVETATGSMKAVNKDKNYKETGSVLYIEKNGDIVYNGEMKHIKMRGNASVTMDKKNYTVKLMTGAKLGGMKKAKSWVLLGSFRDHTLLRNQITYSMAKYAGLPYTSSVAQIDLYLNHEYNGTYLLTEKIEVGKNRININDLDKANEAVNAQLPETYPLVGTKKTLKGKYKAYKLDNDPDDITGGYIIEYENWRARYSDAKSSYTTTRGKVLNLKTPEYASVKEIEYISEFMQGYEDAIFADDGIDPKSGKHYYDFVDFDSLVRKYMLEEISMNEDGNGSSQYYVKPSDSESKVAFAGPCWDYDMTYACYESSQSRGVTTDPEIFLHNKVNASLYWWPQLYRKPEFFEAVCETWKTTYSKALRILLGKEEDPNGILLSIDRYTEQFRASADMNFIRWPISKSGAPKNNKRTGLTFDENITFLKNVIEKRYAFLDEKWGPAE